MRHRTRWVIGGGTAAVLVAVSVGVGVASGLPGRALLRGSADLEGASASATITDATPRETWAGQVNPRQICAAVPGCVEGTRTATGWRLSLAAPVSGNDSATVPVEARILSQQPPTSIRMVLSASRADLGEIEATVRLRLSARGSDTLVRLDVSDVRASGLMSTVVAPALAQGLQQAMDEWAGNLSFEREVAGIRVTVSGRASALRGPAARAGVPAGDRPGARRGVVRVRVSSASLAVVPPTASGVLRVYDGDRVLCRGPVRDSRGSCRFRGPAGPATLQALVTGQMSDGLPVWNATTTRWTP